MASAPPPVPTKITLDRSEVELGGSVEITVLDDRGDAMDFFGAFPIEITSEPVGIATISGGTVEIAEKLPPPLPSTSTLKRTVVKIDLLKAPGSTVVVASVELNLILPWTAIGPRTADSLPGIAGTKPWTYDPKAQRARFILHDLLLQLPNEFTQPLDGLPVVIRDSGYGGEYSAVPFAAEHIYITPSSYVSLNPNSDTITHEDRQFATLMVHEMAHAWLARASGGGLMNGLRGASALATLGGGLFLQGYAVGGVVAALMFPPAWPALIAISGTLATWGGGMAMAQGLLGHDEMSEWCRVSDWRQRNLSGLSIPLLGSILFMATEDYPNIATALLAATDVNWVLDIRNAKFDLGEVRKVAGTKQETNGTTTTGYFVNPTGVWPLVQGSGVASPYAGMSPMEDFAEAYTAIVLKLNAPVPPLPMMPDSGNLDPLVQPKTRGIEVMPNTARQDYFRKRKLIPSKDVLVGASGPARDLTKLGGWKVQSVPPDEDALATAAEEATVLEAFIEAQDTWNKGPAKSLAKAQNAIGALSKPAYQPGRLFSFWAALECHGDGLEPLDPKGTGSEQSDVVTGADQRVYVVHSVNEGGISGLIGGFDEAVKGGGTVPLERLQLCYRWLPNPEPRRFAKVGEYGAAYTDIEDQLRTMIQWWGDAELEKKSLSSLNDFTDAFAQVLSLPDAPHVRCERSLARAAVSRLHLLGDGVNPYDAAQPAQIGDVVLRFDGNSLGIVTRLDEEGRPLDILSGGTTPVGRLGEDAGAVRLEHRIDHRDIHFLWQPNSQLRKFTMPNANDSDAGFTDLDHVLHHLVAHDGAKKLLRQEADVYPLEPLGFLVGLMVEGEPDAQRRKGFSLSVHSSDEEVLARMVAFGDLRIRPDALRIGDVLLLAKGGSAVVLKTDGVGASQVMRVKEGDELVLDHGTIATDDVAAAWQPASERRHIEPVDRSLDAFYGGDGLQHLLSLPQVHANTDSVRLTLHGDTQTAALDDETGVAEVATADAPEWVRSRLWDPDDAADLAEVCNTLGDGLRDVAGPVPIGAWLFASDGVGIVVAVDSQGVPALVYKGDRGRNRASIQFHSGNKSLRIWVPSIEARIYVTDRSSPGYEDRNRLIGLLNIWGVHKSELSTPLFADHDLRASGGFTPAAVAVLKKGPDSVEEWPQYLADNGKLAAGVGVPGDLLVFDDKEKQAVLLDDGKMLVLNGGYGRVSIRQVAGVTGHWVPVR